MYKCLNINKLWGVWLKLRKILYNVHARTLLYNTINGLHKSYKSVQNKKTGKQVNRKDKKVKVKVKVRRRRKGQVSKGSAAQHIVKKCTQMYTKYKRTRDNKHTRKMNKF